jgi:three-Cys-motif partner protein
MLKLLEPEDDGLLMRETGSWAAEKLDYLARYINVFETAMRERWKTRCYLDLMAGPGKNLIRDSGAVLLGSPLLSLTTPHPFTHYFFAEASEENYQALHQRCAASPYLSQITIRSGDCNKLVNEFVDLIKQNDQYSLNLAFLDPEGFELRWETVAKIATIKRIDLVINYPQGGLNRLMPKIVDSADQNQIDLFFGGLEWRQIYKDGRNKSGLHRALIDYYKDKLHRLGYKQVLRDDEVGDEPLMRNAQKNAPLYRLLFASKHSLGTDFWQKVTRRDVYGQSRLF